MLKLVIKYKEIITYLFFGVCTTLVNISAYYIASRFLKMEVTQATVFSWMISVVFAYITNRIWVFKSRAVGIADISKEFIAFIGCRLFSGILDLGIMYIFVDILKMNDLVIKLISNVIVIFINYIASKLIIFK